MNSVKNSTLVMAFAVATTVLLLALGRPVSGRILFEDVTSPAGIDDTGETWGTSIGDLNGDGCPDVWIDKHQYTPTVILLNQCNGTISFDQLVEEPDNSDGGQLLGSFPGVTDTHGAAFGDFDNDGDADVIEASGAAWDNLFWVNNDLGSFTNEIADMGFVYPVDPSVCVGDDCNSRGRRAPMWFDYDEDGDLDVMLTARGQIAVYRSPTSVFQQNTRLDGSPIFEYDGTTGVNYANSYFCAYAMLAELSGDGVLDTVCADTSHVTAVWDITQLPFREISSLELGSALFDSYPWDLVIGDFDGDLDNDVFAPVGDIAQLILDQAGTQTLHYLHKAGAGVAHAGFSFSAQGNLTIDFDWWTQVSSVHIGASGYSPPLSADLRIYDGVGHHVHLSLSPTDSRNWGQPSYTPGISSGIYIWYDGARWQVRTSNINSIVFEYVGMLIQASESISQLDVIGPVRIGQPAQKLPLLFIQDQLGRLQTASGRISSVPSSCVSATAADFDNDGDLDLIESCSGRVSNLPNRVYENDGNANFTRVPNAGADSALGFSGAGGQMPLGRGYLVVTADFDLDGRIDVFLSNSHPMRPFSYTGQQQVFRNMSDNDNNWVQIDLEAELSNRDAIGARVFATTPDGKTQVREQGNGMHKFAQDFKRIHFGVGQNQEVDLEIVWPDGSSQVHEGLVVNQIYHCLEDDDCLPIFDGDVSACGTPALRPAAEAGLFLWEEDCGNPTRSFEVRALQGGTTTVRTYEGRVDSDQAFGGVTPVSLEFNDVLELLNGNLQIHYQMVVRSPYQDGFGFSAPNTANMCFGMNLPAGTMVRVGPNKTPLAAPFDLTTLESCTAPPPPTGICGAPAAGPATDAGLFLWEEDCGGATRSYLVRAWYGGQAGVVNYQGLVTSDQVFLGVNGVALEFNDVLTLSNANQQIDYSMFVRSPYEDGFNFTAPDGASVCFGVNMPAGTLVQVGPSRTLVSAPFSLPDLAACTP